MSETLLRLAGGVRWLPLPRQEFGQAVGGMGGEAGQDVAKVVEGIDVMTLAGGDEAEEDRGGDAAGV